MIVIAYIPLLLALVGLLMYMLSANAKVAEVGRLMFGAGFLVTMLTVAHQVLRLGA